MFLTNRKLFLTILETFDFQKMFFVFTNAKFILNFPTQNFSKIHGRRQATTISISATRIHATTTTDRKRSVRASNRRWKCRNWCKELLSDIRFESVLSGLKTFGLIKSPDIPICFTLCLSFFPSIRVGEVIKRRKNVFKLN